MVDHCNIDRKLMPIVIEKHKFEDRYVSKLKSEFAVFEDRRKKVTIE